MALGRSVRRPAATQSSSALSFRCRLWRRCSIRPARAWPRNSITSCWAATATSRGLASWSNECDAMKPIRTAHPCGQSRAAPPQAPRPVAAGLSCACWAAVRARHRRLPRPRHPPRPARVPAHRRVQARVPVRVRARVRVRAGQGRTKARARHPPGSIAKRCRKFAVSRRQLRAAGRRLRIPAGNQVEVPKAARAQVPVHPPSRARH